MAVSEVRSGITKHGKKGNQVMKTTKARKYTSYISEWSEK